MYIDEEKYRIIKEEPYEFTCKDIGTNRDCEQITYIQDKDTEQLYVTLTIAGGQASDIMLPIQNTDRIQGFRYNFHREENKRKDRKSWIDASNGIYQLPHFKVTVRFRYHHFFTFVSSYLTFGLVYVPCKYFFDRLYPEGYRRRYPCPVDFEAGAVALNEIKLMFGKKSTRKMVDKDYMLKHYARQRDLLYLNEYSPYALKMKALGLEDLMKKSGEII